MLRPLARAARPVLALLDPEHAHRATLAAAGLLRGAATGGLPRHDGRLATSVLGHGFATPIGLAAGFDKDGRGARAWGPLGFGFAEIGTVTPRPQGGNPRPRLFRLPEERAVINRMGFNNEGIDACVARLARARAATGGTGIPIGLNVGINKDGADPERDYPALAARANDVADYLVLNVSSPNTPGLRDLQGEARLGALLDVTVPRSRVPVLVKLAPDLADAAIPSLVRLVAAHGAAGLIIANTTVARPQGLRGRYAGERGGLSGRPLRDRARAMLAIAAATRASLDTPLVLISCGGIETGDDVLDRLRTGADLVQLYTGFAYEGAALLPRLERELLAAMDRAEIGDLAGRSWGEKARALPWTRQGPEALGSL